MFAKIREQRIGKVRYCSQQKPIGNKVLFFLNIFFAQITVFFCGNPTLGKMLKSKCDEFGFTFRFQQFKHFKKKM